MSAKVGQGWRRAFAPYTTNDNQNNLRISAGRGAVINAVGQTQLQAQVIENQQDVQNRDFAYYQLRATREALEGIRKVAKKLSKDVVELPGKVIVNHNELLKQESFQNELAEFCQQQKVHKVMQKYSQKMEKVESSNTEKGNVTHYNVSKEVRQKFLNEYETVTNEDIIDALNGFLAKKFPGKEIIICPDKATMAERIAQESELYESFPSQKKIEADFKALNGYEPTFYDNIAKGVLFAFFVPKNDPKTIEALRLFNLNDTLKLLENIEGKKINNHQELRFSRIFVHQVIRITKEYANKAYQSEPEIFNDPKKNGWNLRKIALIASN